MKRSILFLLLFTPLWAQDFVPGRYIVELAGEPAVRASTRAARRAAVATEQRPVERALAARGVRVTAAVDTVANALIVEANDESALLGLTGVKKIHRVRRYKPVLLDYELDIHQTRDAWSIVGGDSKAGEGMKIAILDSGIDVTHPAFNQPDLKAPDGYPQVDRETNRQFTSGKIIVARSYDGQNAFDRDGHGTAVASVAAAAPHDSTAGYFAGAAPRAWLGAYRVTDFEGYYPSDYILRALDDAVKDGMDVINMSFGSPGVGQQDEMTVIAFERCLENGIILVRSAGNTAGAMTVDDEASYGRVIAVGATQNSRLTTTPAVVPSQGVSIPAGTSTNISGFAPVSGPLFDVATSSDPDGLGCSALPEGTMPGKIAIIRRGVCTFWLKIRNAQVAGAIGAIVYNSPAPPDGSSPEDIINMDLSSAEAPVTIPALFIGNSSGLRLLEQMKSTEDFTVQLRFGAVPNNPKLLTSFTSQGPGIALAIKPDIVAVGSQVAAAVPTGTCDLCSSAGYVRISGTSFSGPYAAGAAALLKAARKGLSVDEYRSLIVNSTTSVNPDEGPAVSVMSAGSGLLNVKNALESTLAAAPVSLTFGSGGSTVEQAKQLKLKNLSSEALTLTLSVDSPNEAKAAVSPDTLTLGGGETAAIEVSLRGSGLADGAYQGFIVVNNSLNGVATRVPYWYAVKTADVPKSIVIVDVDETASLSGSGRALVRIHDGAGLPLGDFEPKVTPLTTGAEVVSIARSPNFPNTWRITVRPGRVGTNSFRVEAGEVTQTFSIQGR
jgi:subtilisin family serine protease